MNKIFKTLDEQIKILKNKNLIINDEDEAKKVLLKENYFFISGYRHLLMQNYKDKCFITGATFDELYSIFSFDRNIRNICFKNILIIENNIKSIISYELSKKYGFQEKVYLNSNNYTSDPLKAKQVHDVLNKMRKQLAFNGRKHSATTHYMDNYGYIPMWILVKVLSFGLVAEFYCILKIDDKEEIARMYNISIDEMEVFLYLLANFRNICAHEDILYDHRTQRSIPDNGIHSHLNIEKFEDEYKYGKNDLFALMIIFKYMLAPSEFREMIRELGYEINILEQKVSSVPVKKILNKIGFPSNWEDIVRFEVV
ncbi:MAG: Abi family protein [Bacilli bacterium]|nr:Abi family protein [Bacilli bacterium]